MTLEEIGTERAHLTAYVEAITNKIDTFLDSEITQWSAIDGSIAAPLTALTEFFHGGGKRLRPAFCYLGFRAGSSDIINDDIVNVGCALELLHNFALIHDDFMDRADTRRGIPTVHKFLEAYYSRQDYVGDIEHFANSVAVLTGDFAYTYADRFARGLPARCLDVYDALKVELFAGQQMDLDAVYRSSITRQKVSLIAQYKSGKYTIERPLQLGSLLADERAPHDLWSGFGQPLGEAFQLRDDILGIFGDESLTGKPVGDDIREGKFTLLIAEAIERSSRSDQTLLDLRGNPELTFSQIEEIVSVIDACGARAAVEERITSLFDQASNSLEKLDLSSDILKFAQYLARYVCWREM